MVLFEFAFDLTRFVLALVSEQMGAELLFDQRSNFLLASLGGPFIHKVHVALESPPVSFVSGGVLQFE